MKKKKTIKVLTPLKAMRAKCIECSAGDKDEVKNCSFEECPLHPYRMGRDPNREGAGNKKSDKKNLKQNTELSSVKKKQTKVK